MKRIFSLIALVCLLSSTACTVTMITGYDQVLDQTLNKIKTDFNLHFIKLSRTLQDNDPNNQEYAKFQDYYDKLQADLITIKDRTKFLGGKSAIVKQQVSNLDVAFQQFISTHKQGMSDRQNDDRHEMRNAVNTSIDAVTFLQQALKTKASTK